MITKTRLIEALNVAKTAKDTIDALTTTVAEKDAKIAELNAEINVLKQNDVLNDPEVIALVEEIAPVVTP